MKKILAVCAVSLVCMSGLYGCAGVTGRNIDTDDGIIDNGYNNDNYDDDGIMSDDGVIGDVADGITDGINNTVDNTNMPV